MAKKVKRIKAKAKARKLKLEVVYEALSKLKLWDKNPRVNDEAAKRLCVLMERYGFVNPIIATPDGTIRAGHTRYKAAKQLGIETVPVIYVPFASEEEAQMYSLADNKSAEWADWDKDALAKLLVRGRGVSLKQLEGATGFQQLEIEGIRNEFGLPESPDDINSSMLPTPLAATGIEGADGRTGRVIVVYYNLREREALEELLGVKFKSPGAGSQQVWRVTDLGSYKKRSKKKKARRV